MYEDEHDNLSYENIKQYAEAQAHKLFPLVMGSFTSFPGSLILMPHPGNEVDGFGPRYFKLIFTAPVIITYPTRGIFL